jgi:hypothetical protein
MHKEVNPRSKQLGSKILSPFYLSLTQYFLIPPLAHKEKMARIGEILMRYEKTTVQN